MRGILLAVGVNSLVKLGIVFFLGGRKLGALMGIFYLLSLGAMAGSLIFEVGF